MTERPILFSAPMVQALLAGRKTMTRRLTTNRAAARIEVGDLLYVRETWNLGRSIRNAEGIIDDEMLWPGKVPKTDPRGKRIFDEWCVGYAADGLPGPWRPSIHMPRWAARIWLRVTDVRVERVQDITEADARAEGCIKSPRGACGQQVRVTFDTAREHFAAVWRDCYGPESWDANSWVWRIAFERTEAPAREGGR